MRTFLNCRRTGIILSSFFFVISVCNSFAEHKVIEQVKQNYRRGGTVSAKCRKIYLSRPSEDTEFYIYRKGHGCFRVEFLEPERSVCISNEKEFYIFLEKRNIYGKFNRGDFNDFEKQLADAINVVNFNLFEAMKDEYGFELKDSVKNTMIFSAVPRAGWKNLSMILIRVDVRFRVIVAIEIFDKNKKLISQNLFLEPKEFEGGIFLPTVIESRNVQGSQLLEERIKLTRIAVNRDMPDSLFVVKPPKDAKRKEAFGLIDFLGFIQ